MELQSMGCQVFGNISQPEFSTDGIKNSGSGDYSECSHTLLDQPVESPIVIELADTVVCKKIMFYPRAERFNYVTKITLYGSNTKTSDISRATLIGNFDATIEPNHLTTFSIINEKSFKYYLIANKSDFNGSFVSHGFFWVELEVYGFVAKDEEPNFPVKVGNESHVIEYAKTLIKGEEQLLITREGILYLTDGNGGFKNISETDLTNYYTKPEVNTLIADVDNKSHEHTNKTVVDNLSDSANLLTYKGKVVVNNNEYSFKTLPRRKAPTSNTYTNSNVGGRLPWQQ